MKNIFTTAVLLVVYTVAQGQILLENTYNKVSGLSVIAIEDEGNKYLCVDTVSKDAMLYNGDHSLWKRIPLWRSSDAGIPGVLWVAKKLVDADNDLELCYAFVSMFAGKPVYTTNIINEDGGIIKTFDNTTYCYPQKVNGNWKLVVNYYNAYQTEVYSVPGKYLPLAIKPAAGPGTTEEEAAMLLYPNPMDVSATLHYTLPSGVHSATMSIIDITGKVVLTYTVTDQFSDILINRGDLPAGTYSYKLYGQTGVLSVEKFIIK